MVPQELSKALLSEDTSGINSSHAAGVQEGLLLARTKYSSEGASRACRKKLSGLDSSRLIPDIDGKRAEFEEEGTARGDRWTMLEQLVVIDLENDVDDWIDWELKILCEPILSNLCKGCNLSSSTLLFLVASHGREPCLCLDTPLY